MMHPHMIHESDIKKMMLFIVTIAGIMLLAACQPGGGTDKDSTLNTKSSGQSVSGSSAGNATDVAGSGTQTAESTKQTKAVPFKGLELCIWKNPSLTGSNDPYYTLLIGTNRNKTNDEIYDLNVAVNSIDRVNEMLAEYSSETQVMVFQMNNKDFTKEEMDIITGRILLPNRTAITHVAVMEQPTDPYSFIIKEQVIPLQSWNTEVDLYSILGKPVTEGTEKLGDGADTFAGSHLKRLKYDKLSIDLFSPSDNGKTYWIICMNTTNPDIKTPAGIHAGSTVAELKKAYHVEIIPDGRTDPDNCAYNVHEELKNLEFEVNKGVVKEIVIYHDMP